MVMSQVCKLIMIRWLKLKIWSLNGIKIKVIKKEKEFQPQLFPTRKYRHPDMHKSGLLISSTRAPDQSMHPTCLVRCVVVLLSEGVAAARSIVTRPNNFMYA